MVAPITSLLRAFTSTLSAQLFVPPSSGFQTCTLVSVVGYIVEELNKIITSKSRCTYKAARVVAYMGHKQKTLRRSIAVSRLCWDIKSCKHLEL